ncbi:MAG: nucleoside-diphosphate kinase [Thermodesulfovibrionales bacterium]|nr:nucleoside-diphosphate kinase [Thermodesulfovibrionales bacterium]
MQQTLSIVKPDGVQKNIIGEVITRFERAGLKIAALRMVKLGIEEAGRFYIVHKERPFYGELTAFISEGPIVVMVIEGKDAIKRVRDIMGATNPKEARPGTIRADFATNIERNIVHGSDSPESAAYEIPFFFSAPDIMKNS